MKKKEERMERQMNEVMAENRRLTEPLQRAREEVEELRRQLANYDKDKRSLAVSSVTIPFISLKIVKKLGLRYCK